MKLYSTLTSPYARMARIVRREKGLEEIVSLESVATRGDNNPYYAVNPSGRVPSLELEDGRVLEDSALICWYLDNIDGRSTLHPSEDISGLEGRRIEAIARSMLDGTSVWWREYLYRSPEIHSATIMNHEKKRAIRLANVFEEEVKNATLSGPLNIAQITLACVFHGRKNAGPAEFLWEENRPNLCAWVKRIGNINSIKETAPPSE